MVYRIKIIFATVLFLNILFVFHCPDLPAAETGLIKPGDKVGIQFTCRFKNGEIASSTSTAVAGNTEPKSAIFLPRNIDDPVAVTAGESSKDQHTHDFIAFEDEIITQLAHSIAGMPLNGSGTIELHADRIAGLPPKDQFLQLARVRVQPKEIRMTGGEFKLRTGKEPAVGEEFTLERGIPGKVASVSENEVLIRFSVQPGSVIVTPFGKGTVRENEKNYEIVIDASVGRLVRMRGLVGRVSEVQDRTFTVDYGNPFGGETLSCDVKVEPAPPADVQRVQRNSPMMNRTSFAALIARCVGHISLFRAFAGCFTRSTVLKRKRTRPLPLPGEAAKCNSLAQKRGAQTLLSPPVTPDKVKEGDLVKLNFTASNEKGEIVRTTDAQIVDDPNLRKAAAFQAAADYVPEDVWVGHSGLHPRLGRSPGRDEGGGKENGRISILIKHTGR